MLITTSDNYEGTYFDSRDKDLKVNIDSSEAQFPTNAIIELSNGCNHKCIFCYNTLMERKVSILSIEKYSKFVSEAVSLGLQEVGLYSTGEPFLVKNLSEYILIAKKYGIKRVYITTNGSLASIESVKQCVEAGLDSIKFSINASNKIDYEKVHGKDDWDTVLGNISDIYKFKVSLEKSSGKSLQLLGSCIMTTLTGDIRDEHREIFGEMFEDTTYAFAQNQAGHNTQYTNQFSLPEKITPESDISPCEMLWNRLHFTAEGYLSCCCVDYEHDLVYSTLQNETLHEAWNNELIKSVRQKHLEKNLCNLICHGCLTGEKHDYSPISDTPQNVKLQRNSNNKKVINYIERLSEFNQKVESID